MVGSRLKSKTSISKIEKMKFHGSPIAFKPSHTACTGASNCGEAEFGEVGGALRGAGEDSLEQQSSALACTDAFSCTDAFPCTDACKESLTVAQLCVAP